MADKTNVLQSTECKTANKKTVSELHVNLCNVEYVQIGAGEDAVNNIVFLSSKGLTDPDEHVREEKNDSGTKPGFGKYLRDSVTDLDGFQPNVVFTNDDGFTTSYTVIQGKTVVSVGNNRIVEININENLMNKLTDSGEFKVTSGEDLVSIIWSCDQKLNSQTITELKVRFLHDNGSTDTSEIETEIFKRIRSEEHHTLKKLITKLLAVYKAKLKHIRTGCIQCVLSTDNIGDAQRLLNKQDELKELLKSTIVPNDTEIEVNINIREEALQIIDDNIQATPAKPTPAFIPTPGLGSQTTTFNTLPTLFEGQTHDFATIFNIIVSGIPSQRTVTVKTTSREIPQPRAEYMSGASVTPQSAPVAHTMGGWTTRFNIIHVSTIYNKLPWRINVGYDDDDEYLWCNIQLGNAYSNYFDSHNIECIKLLVTYRLVNMLDENKTIEKHEHKVLRFLNIRKGDNVIDLKTLTDKTQGYLDSKSNFKIQTLVKITQITTKTQWT